MKTKLKKNTVILSIEEYDRLKGIENTYGKKHTVEVKESSTIYNDVEAVKDMVIEMKEKLARNEKLEAYIDHLELELSLYKTNKYNKQKDSSTKVPRPDKKHYELKRNAGEYSILSQTGTVRYIEDVMNYIDSKI